MGKRSRRRDRESPVADIKSAFTRLERAHKEVVSVVDAAMIDPEVPVEELAPLFLDLYRWNSDQEEIGAYVSREGPPGRASRFAEAILSLEPESLAAVTFAAGVAEAEGDAVKCAELYERAFELAPDNEYFPGLLALSYYEAGRIADGLDVAEALADDEPWDVFATDALRDGLVEASQRLSSMDANQGCTCASGLAYGVCCKPREKESVDRFLDGTEFDQVLAEVRAYASRPEFRSLIESEKKEWYTEEASETMALSDDAFMAWIFEHPFPDSDDEEREPPLWKMSDDSSLTGGLQSAAGDLMDGRWGLWQVSGGTMKGPGHTLTDLISGLTIYANVKMEGPIHPWSVLMGWMAPLHGIWRNTPAIFPLSPDEGWNVAHFVEDSLSEIIDENKEEYDSSSDLKDVVADSILHFSIPNVRSKIYADRREMPDLINTDREPIRFLRLEVKVNERAALESALESHPDFKREVDGFTWFGSDLPKGKAKDMKRLAEKHGEVVDSADRPRWVRGGLTFKDDHLIIEVNSEARRDGILEVLRSQGIELKVAFQSVVDPKEDLILPVETLNEEPVEDLESSDRVHWTEDWLDEEIPGLGGLTPRQAAKDEEARWELEGLLRDFEYRASVARSKGRPAPDIAKLRDELGF